MVDMLWRISEKSEKSWNEVTAHEKELFLENFSKNFIAIQKSPEYIGPSGHFAFFKRLKRWISPLFIKQSS